MPKFCKICRKTNKEGVSLFSLPSRKRRLEKWLEILQIDTYNDNTRICSEHFHKKFIVNDNRGCHLLSRDKAVPFKPGTEAQSIGLTWKKVSETGVYEDSNLKLISDDSCRMCMINNNRDNVMYSLFGTVRDHFIPGIIEELLGIKVVDTDRLKSICEICLSKIDLTYTIFKEFKVNEEKLEEILVKWDDVEVLDEINSCSEAEIQDEDILVEEFIDEVEGEQDAEVNTETETVKSSPIEIERVEEPADNDNVEILEEAELDFIEKINSKYKCNICKAVIESTFQEHLETHVPFHCNFCQKSINQESSLKDHILYRHTAEKRFGCGACMSYFKSKKYLLVHIKNKCKGKLKEIQCRICLNFLENEIVLMDHYRADHPVNIRDLIGCDSCNKFFQDENSLQLHKFNHRANFNCLFCDKKMKSASALADHENSHTGLKPYSCTQCNRHFGFVSNLVRHRKLHEGTKNFKCDVCEKLFSLKENLKTHLRIHTGDKIYACNLCQKRFTDNSTLIRHKRRHK